MNHRRRWATMLGAAVLASCGTGVVDSVRGVPPSSGRYVAIAVSLPYGDRTLLRAEVNARVQRAVDQGDQVDVIIAPGAASAAILVSFGEASHHGLFVPTGKNPAAWERSRQAMAAAARLDVAAAFDRVDLEQTGGTVSDPLGTLALGVSYAMASTRARRATVIVLATGVQRMSGDDMLVAGELSAGPSTIGSAVPVAVRLVGVGQFGPAVPDVDPAFSVRVWARWSALCAGLADCALRPFGTADGS